MLFVTFPLMLLIFFYLCLIFISLINMCLGMLLFLDLSCMGLSGLPGLEWLFPFPCYGIFQL